ncbi:diguanylate cyclase (GGDEF)-like protein/PAS domain S-box-containing protein [Oxalobacteraceae bacterium GrIS 1.11]
MLSYLNRLSVRKRIWSIVAIFMVGIAVGNVIDVLMLRDALWHEKERETRQQVESGFGILQHYHALQQRGALSETAAQAAAIGAIKAMRYGEQNYFWLNDLGTPFPSMVMHPTMPELDGQLVDAAKFNSAVSLRIGNDGPFVSASGNLFAAFVDVAKRGGQGYVTYFWSKPKTGGGATEQSYLKLSYVKQFAPWGWLIGSGVYVGDVERAVQAQVLRKVLLVLLGGTILLMFASALARSITAPLRLIITAMRAIGKGDLTLRLPAQGDSEIAELGRGVNDMLEHLQIHEAELARHRASLEDEVLGRTGELKDANARLEKELGERKQAEHAIRESRARISVLLNAGGEAILLLTPVGKVLALNSLASSRLGFTPEAMIDKNFLDFVPPALAATRLAALQQVAVTGEALHMQDQRGAISFSNSLYPVKDEGGAVESIAVYARDISEQHRAQKVDDLFHHLTTLLLTLRMNLDTVAQMFCEGILPVFELVAAWVGRIEKDGRLTLLARAGATDGAGPAAPGAAWVPAALIRKGKRQNLNRDDAAWPPCGAAACNPEAGTALLLPLVLRGEIWGVLALYGAERCQFDTARLDAIGQRLGPVLEAALQQEWLTLLDTALAGVSNAVFITDAEARIVWLNRAFETLSGYTSAEALGQSPSMFRSSAQDAAFYRRFWDTIKSGATWHGEVINAHRDGSTYTVSQTVTPLLNPNGQVSHYVAILEDVSARKASEEKVLHSASFDLLTDLPNRGLFFDRLGQALILARRDGQTGALLFLDLDHFKQVNDQLGHAAGDSLLIEVARRLRAQVRESDTVARLGGDEFTVILPHLQNGTDAARIAEQILAAIAQPCTIAGQALTIELSIGIALFPEHGQTVEEIVNAADEAMYRAKKAGRHQAVFAVARATDASA